MEPPPPPSELAELPPEVDEIVLRGLAPDPEDRWPDGPGVRQRAAGAGPERGTDPARQPARASRRSRPGRPRRRRLPRRLDGCCSRWSAWRCSWPASAARSWSPSSSTDRTGSIPGDARPEHYRARWVTPPLVARTLRHPPAWRDRKRHQHVCGPLRSRLPGRPPRGRPDGVDVFELGAEHEQVVFCNDHATGLQGDRRDPLHRPRARSRRHPLLPLRDDRGRDPRRPQPLARDVLQGRPGRASTSAAARP